MITIFLTANLDGTTTLYMGFVPNTLYHTNQNEIPVHFKFILLNSSEHWTNINPFKDEAQAALFKDPVRTALWTLFISVIKTNQFML
jgi:hypothetical protein